MNTIFQSSSMDKKPLPMIRPEIRYYSTPCRLVLEDVLHRDGMAELKDDIHEWSSVVLGEIPVKFHVWESDESGAQVFMKFKDKVLVTDLSFFGGVLIENNDSLYIELDKWKPGSVQARQIPNGSIRIKYRTNEIFLKPQIRAPEWAAALIEEWLMHMRGDKIKPRSKAARLADLKRKSETISRLLEQIDFTELKDDISYTRSRLVSADEGLSERAK
jgi:hypothetical protein